jgi:poly(3-hydroxybutyrate) depolymerase
LLSNSANPQREVGRVPFPRDLAPGPGLPARAPADSSTLALFGYCVYTPAPEIDQLSGTLTKGFIEVGGLKRTYLTYVPRRLATGAPLVVVMHGSGEDSAQARRETGYGLDRLADEQGFAVVYPDGTRVIGTRATLLATTARTRSTSTMWGS